MRWSSYIDLEKVNGNRKELGLIASKSFFAFNFLEEKFRKVGRKYEKILMSSYWDFVMENFDGYFPPGDSSGLIVRYINYVNLKYVE